MEVIDQSIRMLRSIRDCRDIGTSDKEGLESLAAAFAHVLSSLNDHIGIKPVTPETVVENCLTVTRNAVDNPNEGVSRNASSQLQNSVEQM